MSKVEEDKVDNLPFFWGKKRGVGGKNKEVQFYESFTYDGVKYTLYDCVYMYKEGEPGPYVGKLIKIWENSDKKKTKKVKLQWFFQPYEIVNWLGDVEVRPNEIFLASGKGVGLANANPLEAIAGKCNVVCISEDSRNRQPSAKDVEEADYIFYRTFDVEHCSISDKLDDKVGEVEVKFVFNKEISEPPGDTHGLRSNQMEGAGVCNPEMEILGKGAAAIVEVEGKDGGTSHLALKGSEDVKVPAIKSKSSPRGESASGSPEDLIEVASSSGQLETVRGEITARHRDSQEDAKVKVSANEEDSLIKLKASPKSGSAFGTPEDSSEVIATNGRRAPVSGDKTKPSNFDSHKDDAKVTKVGSKRPHVEEPKKHAKKSDPVGNKPSKKSAVEDSVKPLENRTTKSSQKMLHVNNAKGSEDVKGPVTKSKISPRGESASGSPEDLIEVATSGGRLEAVQGEITSGHRDSKEDAKVKVSADEEDSLIKLISSSKRRSAFGAPEDSSRVITTNGRQAPVSGDKTKPSNFESHKDNAKVSKAGTSRSHLEEPIKHAKESEPVGNKPSQKSVVEDSVKPLENRTLNSSQKMVHVNNTKASAVVSSEKKTKGEPGKDSPGLDKGVRSTKNQAPLEERPSKKARVETSEKSNEIKQTIGIQKCSTSAAGNNAKDSTVAKKSAGPVTASERSNSKVGSVQFDNDNKKNIDEKKTKVANSQLTKVASGHSRDASRKKGDIIEVSRRPDDWRSNWFEEIDIIWHAFDETCAAKRLPSSAISSPHSGQAFIILRTSEAAKKIVREADDGCLLLPNGRPLVASFAPPLNFPGKQSTFFGHLTIPNLKPSSSKEKEAVSTSHCAQPNTVEYEMAMEWFLLQERADRWWERVYEKQRQDLRKLRSSLKLK